MVSTVLSPASGIRVLPGDLTALQRHGLAAMAVVLHVVVGYWVWHAARAPVAPAEQAPIMVSLITDQVSPPAPISQPAPEPPKAQAVQSAPVPPAPKREAPPILAAPRPAQPQDMQVPVAVPEPRVAPAVTTPIPVQPVASAAAVPTTAAVPSNVPVTPPTPPQPKTLPSSDVRFLIKPEPVYPQASQELGESGKVEMLILVDEHGKAKKVTVTKSSGYPRLDRAAVAAEMAARFQPHLEAGVPVSVSAPHTIIFVPNEH